MRAVGITISVSFVWGVVVASCTGMTAWLIHAVIGVVVCLLVRRGFGTDSIPVWLFVVAYGVGGGMYQVQHTLNVSSVSVPNASIVQMEAIIDSAIRLDGDRAYFTVKAFIVQTDRSRWSGSERMRVTMRLVREEEVAQVRTWGRGDRVLFQEATMRRPETARNFGAFDYARYVKQDRIHWLVQVVGLSQVRHRVGTGSFWRGVDDWRQMFVQRVRLLYDQPVSGLMEGLLIGFRETLEPEYEEYFERLGLTHVLAISGLNVALYVGTILLLLRCCPWWTQESKWWIAIGLIPPFIWMTGAEPSVVRAGLMAMIALYAASRKLLTDGLHILGAAAVLMLLWDPLLIHDVGFQLSFVVTMGLLLGVPRFMQWWGTRMRWLGGTIGVTVVAQVVSFPLTIYYFHAFSLLSTPANWVLVPLYSSVVLPLGAVSVGLSFVVPQGAQWIAAGVDWLVSASLFVMSWLAQWEWATTIWASQSGLWVVVYYGLLGAGIALMAWYKDWTMAPRRRGYGFVVAMGLLGCVGYAYGDDWSERRTAMVAFLDVGQGDATLVRTATGKHVLIDCGGTPPSRGIPPWAQRHHVFEVGKDVLFPLLKQRGIKRLEALVLTHADMDHVGGCAALIENMPIERIFFNGTVKSSPVLIQLFRDAVSRNIPLIPLHAGSRHVWDDATSWEVLHPADPDPTSLRPPVQEQQNEFSIVLLMRIYGTKFLLTGDIGVLEEERLSRTGETVDVLKVAHHGSRTSTSEALLLAWKPRMGVISVGVNNRYRHPHPDVMERLMRHRVVPLRTDVHGEVQFRITKEKLDVRTKRHSVVQ